MEYPNFKVTVSCMTYNQAKYITDAMNGFTMQQTSFPFVCTIVDDASTDGEQDVIRKYVEENFDFSEGSVAYHKETDYAHITYAQHKTNKNCYFAVLYLKENHYSKHKDKSPYLKDWRDGVEYMAICEGDDYWIVPDKLKMQVKFLDENGDYVMVHTNLKWYIQNSDKFIYNNEWKEFNIFLESKQDRIVENILDSNRYYVQTNTVLFRNKVYDSVFHELVQINNKFLLGDTTLWCLLHKYGYIHYDETITSVYRINTGSVSHQSGVEKKLRFYLSGSEMRLFMYNYLDIDNKQLFNKFNAEYKKIFFLYRAYNRNYVRFIEMKWNFKLFERFYEGLDVRVISIFIKHTLNLYLYLKNLFKQM